MFSWAGMLQILFWGIDGRGIVVYRACVVSRGSACAPVSPCGAGAPLGWGVREPVCPCEGLWWGRWGAWEGCCAGGAQRGAEGFVQVRAYVHHSHLGHLCIYVMSCSPLILCSFHP